MPTIKELEAKVDTLQTVLDEEQVEIKAAIDTLTAANADLKTQIADGGTAEERQALADKIDGVIADLKSTIEPAPAPPEG